MSSLKTKEPKNPGDWANWKWQLANSLIGADGVARLLGENDHCELAGVVRRYPFRATPYYLSLIDWRNPLDPIMKQCVPSEHELGDGNAEFVDDPFDEKGHIPVPGLIRRYHNRAVLLAGTSCPVYCRHCTRKNLLDRLEPVNLKAVVAYLRANPEIREVIVSGGDPLLLEDDQLESVLSLLRSIESVEVLRLGTRAPVTMPMRITAGLTGMLSRYEPLWINTQFNHPREITPDSEAACRTLVKAGMAVSNQTVLLKGINDSEETLVTLCNGLQRIMVRPYYVFQCDPVAGTAHFRAFRTTAAQLAVRLRARLGGLACPLFVEDVPGSASKRPILN